MTNDELHVAMRQTRTTASMLQCSIDLNSPDIVKLFCGHYAPYTLKQITNALLKVQGECEFFTLKAVKERIDDGRPGAQEAWGMMPVSSSMSVVWTDEMANAWNAAYPLLDGKQNMAARMAFIESYSALVSKSRLKGVAVNWCASLGDCKLGRESALTEAINLGRISEDHAASLHPELLEGPAPLLLESDSEARYVSPDKLAELKREALGYRLPYTGGGVHEKPSDDDIEAAKGGES